MTMTTDYVAATARWNWRLRRSRTYTPQAKCGRVSSRASSTVPVNCSYVIVIGRKTKSATEVV